jgi:copper homeostasis protein
MERHTILEVCLDSVESCIAAERGGADRVELCANLAEDGTTPSAGMITAARNRVDIAIQVMIRPRAGDFSYTDHEYEAMRRDVAFAKQLGANGVVFGILMPDGRVDLDRTRKLADLARPMSVTFHRAFDLTSDPLLALGQLIESGIERVLTSGQARTAVEGMEVIRELVQKGERRIQIMAGAGITIGNAKQVRDGTGVQEIHVGAGASDPVSTAESDNRFRGIPYRRVNTDKVARIVDALRNH